MRTIIPVKAGTHGDGCRTKHSGRRYLTAGAMITWAVGDRPAMVDKTAAGRSERGLFTTVRYIAAGMLFLALFSLPYGYYQIMRLVVFGVTGYGCYLAYQGKNNRWTILFGIFAILFNPVIPIQLSRGDWVVIDIIAAFVLLCSVKVRFDSSPAE